MKRVIVILMLLCLATGCPIERYASCALAQYVPQLPTARDREREHWFYEHAQLTVWEGDTIPFFQLRPVFIYPPIKFKNDKERENYYKLVRDVKKVKPYADLIQNILMESYNAMSEMTPKQQKAHIEKIEDELMTVYKPVFKKLTFSQGKLLIRLIDKQCGGLSAYELMRSLVGSFRAGLYQSFASLFGASLKKKYDPKGEDKLTERVLNLVMNYQL